MSVLDFAPPCQDVPNRGLREGKRQADAVEDLETSEGKKQKLSDDHPDPPVLDEDAEVVEADAVEQPAEPPVAATSGIAPKPKGKGRGPDLHFKENPYTFLQQEDPIIQACMYVFAPCGPSLSRLTTSRLPVLS